MDDEAAFWQWMRAVAPPPPLPPAPTNHWDRLPQDLHAHILKLRARELFERASVSTLLQISE